MEQLSPTQLIRDDHKMVRGLFRQFEAVDARASEMKRGVVQQILFEIKMHTELEMELFYPALQAALVDERQRLLVNESQADHDSMENLIHELQGMDADDKRFNDKFGELIDTVESHIDKEEATLLPLAEKTIRDSAFTHLGHQMNEARQYALDGAPHLVEQAQNLRGGEQKRRQGRAGGHAA